MPTSAEPAPEAPKVAHTEQESAEASASKTDSDAPKTTEDVTSSKVAVDEDHEKDQQGADAAESDSTADPANVTDSVEPFDEQEFMN